MDDNATIYSRSLFIDNLTRELVKLCTANRLLNHQLYDIPELMEKWRQSAPQYMADAVPEIAKYPMVAIGWALYYGIGAAVYWDGAWETAVQCDDLYAFIRDKRGFDCMDDYITEELVGLKPDSKKSKEQLEAKHFTETIQACAELAYTMIRRQGVEPQSREAFYMFADVEKLMFHLGVSIQMYRMGYRYELANIN